LALSVGEDSAGKFSTVCAQITERFFHANCSHNLV
jgi:hypothetical protein